MVLGSCWVCLEECKHPGVPAHYLHLPHTGWYSVDDLRLRILLSAMCKCLVRCLSDCRLVRRCGWRGVRIHIVPPVGTLTVIDTTSEWHGPMKYQFLIMLVGTPLKVYLRSENWTPPADILVHEPLKLPELTSSEGLEVVPETMMVNSTSAEVVTKCMPPHVAGRAFNTRLSCELLFLLR